MYTNKEVGELLGSVFWTACRFVVQCIKLYIAYHFIAKYW